MNRRQFLQSAGVGVTSVAAGALAAPRAMFAAAAGAAPAAAPRTETATSRPVGANGDIRVAVIGFRAQGKSHIRAYKSIPGVRVVALCDVDANVLNTQADALEKEGITVKRYRDLRKLFDDREIDAVSLAMTNRWHSLAAIWAIQAGKDVCVEKPMSHCIWEGRRVAEAAQKYRRMVQADLDFRSNPSLDEAFAFVRSGQIGRIVYARAWDFKRRETLGKIVGPQKVPAGVDYDLWTGPGPMQPLLREKLHYDWHWQWATGNGEIGNNGSHQLDQVRWALGTSGLPRTVMSFGGRYGYVDDGQTPNTMAALYDYEGIPVLYEARGLARETHADVMDDFVGTTVDGHPVRDRAEGSVYSGVALFCEGGYYLRGRIHDNQGKEIRAFKAGPSPRPQVNFIKAVRSRRSEDLRISAEQGHLSASFCHMGNVSYQCGEPTGFDAARKRLADAASAAQANHAAGALERMIKHLSANGVDIASTPLIIGPTLTMDSSTERFTGDSAERGNLFVKDSYRAPFVVPEQV